MKKFLAVYTGSENSQNDLKWKALDEKSRKEREAAGMKAWMKWGEVNAKSILEHGAPLGKTKLVNSGGVSDYKNALCAYTVVQAESHEAAAKLFVDHPHFSIFPGEAVEIMECLKIPGT